MLLNGNINLLYSYSVTVFLEFIFVFLFLETIYVCIKSIKKVLELFVMILLFWPTTYSAMSPSNYSPPSALALLPKSFPIFEMVPTIVFSESSKHLLLNFHWCLQSCWIFVLSMRIFIMEAGKRSAETISAT